MKTLVGALGVGLVGFAAPPPEPLVFDSESVRFRVETVAEGLKVPSAMAFLPNGRALVTQRKSGEITLLDVGSGRLTPLRGGPRVLTGEDAGLHDVVLHPEHARNGWIYVSYSEGDLSRSTTVVDRMRLRGTELTDQVRVLTADAYSEDRYHYGGRLAFVGPHLYVTVGDRHHQDRAQTRSSHTGAILRVLDDGRVPEGNPFVGGDGAPAEIWSWGHRNPQGLAVHPETGELWSHEHGPLGGDELNLVQKGANYGWPVVSYGWEYSGGPIGMGIVAQQGVQQPAWVWTPAIAPSGMCFYTGDAFPRWRGSLLIGSLSRRHLNRLVLREGAVVLEERLLYRKAGRVRLVVQDRDGLVYIGNDDGRILRLRPAE